MRASLKALAVLDVLQEHQHAEDDESNANVVAGGFKPVGTKLTFLNYSSKSSMGPSPMAKDIVSHLPIDVPETDATDSQLAGEVVA